MRHEENTQTWLFYRWLLKHPVSFILLLLLIALLVGALGYELSGVWRFPALFGK